MASISIRATLILRTIRVNSPRLIVPLKPVSWPKNYYEIKKRFKKKKIFDIPPQFQLSILLEDEKLNRNPRSESLEKRRRKIQLAKSRQTVMKFGRPR